MKMFRNLSVGACAFMRHSWVLSMDHCIISFHKESERVNECQVEQCGGHFNWFRFASGHNGSGDTILKFKNHFTYFNWFIINALITLDFCRLAIIFYLIHFDRCALSSFSFIQHKNEDFVFKLSGLVVFIFMVHTKCGNFVGIESALCP